MTGRPSGKRGSIAIVGSGTRGHVQPAIALAEAISARMPEAETFFVGSRRGQESHLVPAAGYRLELISGAPYYGVGFAGKLAVPGELVRGAVDAYRLLRSRSVGLLVSFGGFTSVGAVLGARLTGIPVLVHEANAAPGLANRITARAADRICVGLAEAREALPANKSVVTGTPVRDALIQRSAQRRPVGANDSLRVLVTGGSLGSAFLNRHVPEALEAVRRAGVALEVEHHTAGIDHDDVVRAYRGASIPAEVVAVTDRMEESICGADFAIARCGAVTLAELAVARVPVLGVPLPRHAGGHQTLNANAYRSSGGAWVIEESEWSPDSVAGTLAKLFADRKGLLAASDAMAGAAVPEAAAALAAQCDDLL